MNRFTKDMATIDDMLPLVLFDLIQVPIINHMRNYSIYCINILMYVGNRPLFCSDIFSSLACIS